MTSPTGNVMIDSILWGGNRWSSNTITYYFSNDFFTWDPAEEDAFRDALQVWADVANLNFVEVFDEDEATFVEHNVDSDYFGGNVLGAHEVPGPGISQASGWFNWEAYGSPDGSGYNLNALQPGGYGFLTYVHEIGHALGLAHPHDTGGGSPRMPGVTSAFGDYGDNNLNQGIFTVMSYNDGWDMVQDPNGNRVSEFGYASGPSAFDIAAIQYLYGANTNHNRGNTTYEIVDEGGWLSIWDAGGTDRIIYNGMGDVVINLNSATLDNSPTGGGSPSYVRNSGSENYYGGFTIAGDFTGALRNRGGERGVIIENATGGSGNDEITGNRVGNKLTGRDGDDIINGNRGQDTLLGNKGDDLLKGGGQDDRLIGHGANDTLLGGNGEDTLVGGNGADTIRGGGHDDTANGGSGGDRIFGQAGNDLVRGGTGHDTIVGNKGEDKLLGHKGNDVLRGGGQDDKVIGHSGKDKLIGGNGDDTIKGGGGNDTIIGGKGNDVLRGKAGADTFVFNSNQPSGDDRIADFENGTDMIRINGAVDFDDLTINRSGGNTVITWDNGSITLDGITGRIDEDDFIFG